MDNEQHFICPHGHGIYLPPDDVVDVLTSLKLHVYCKAHDDSFGFARIHSRTLSRYVFEKETAILLHETIDIPKIHSDAKGRMHIQSLSDIVILEKAALDGTGRAGGVITLISNQNIKIQGMLNCSTLNEKWCGTICIVADTFVNDGEIECIPNGQINIFCREYINNGTIIPEPIVTKSRILNDAKVNSVNETPLSFADYFISSLHFAAAIDRQSLFHQIGVSFEVRWIPLILSHHLFQQHTDELLRKLSEDLKLSIFSLVEIIRRSLIIDEEMSILQKVQDADNIGLSDFVFAIGHGRVYEVSSEAGLFRFDDFDQFRIPLDTAFPSQANSLDFTVFIKADDDSFDFAPIFPISIISERVDVPRFDARRKRLLRTWRVHQDYFEADRQKLRLYGGGTLVIKCISDIIIRPKIEINGSGAKFDGEGADVRIISHGTVVNEGIISCNGSGVGAGGVIYIVADSFVNQGNIECIPNGQIHIFCREYVNNGTITPDPMITKCEALPTLRAVDTPLSFIDYFLSKLDAASDINRIWFFDEIGMSFQWKWIPLILSNRVLSGQSGSNLLRKLARDLKVPFFAFVEGVRQSMVIDEDRVVLRGALRVDNIKLSDFVFAVGFGELSPKPDIFRFDDFNHFSIPLDAALLPKVNSLNFTLFCKPRDDSFDFAPMTSTILNRYRFTKDTPLTITESVDIPHFDDRFNHSGSLMIKCASDIIIAPQIAINGSMVNPDGAGGDLRIISDGAINNHGNIRCNDKYIQWQDSNLKLPEKAFKHVSDFDQNGILWALGTNFGKEKYQNPAQSGKVSIATSPLYVGKSHVFVGRSQVTFLSTKDTQPRFVSVNFGQYAVKPTAYTLRTCRGYWWREHYLKSWAFQGSKDGEHWVILRKHENEMSLNGNGTSHTWHLDEVQDYYSYFRVWMTGVNGYGSWHLLCSGMEIYGDLRIANDARGGVIYIVADSFVNEGSIECEPSGSIHISCREYMNNGVMSPSPLIIISEGAIIESPIVESVDYLMRKLQTDCNPIRNKDAFLEMFGVRPDFQWIQKIAEHVQLFETSEFRAKKLIDRIADELGFVFFAFLRGLFSCRLALDQQENLILRAAKECHAGNIVPNASGLKSHNYQQTRLEIDWRDQQMKLDIGDYVQTLHGVKGIIKYIESGTPGNEERIGLEMDTWDQVGHDGERYFDCKSGYGMWAVRDEISVHLKVPYDVKLQDVKRLFNEGMYVDMWKVINDTKMEEKEDVSRSNAKCPDTSLCANAIHIGDRIRLFNGRTGIIRWKGTLLSQRHFGVELDVTDSDAHNGTHPKLQKRHFRCALNRGIFVMIKDVQENLGCSSSKWRSHKCSKLKKHRVTLKVNDRVQTLIGGSGTIRYLGNPDFVDDLIFGIELDHQSLNASNGTVNGIRYFECGQGTAQFVVEDSIVKRLTERDNDLVTPNQMKLPQLVALPRMHDKVKLIDGQLGVVKFVGQLDSSADTVIGVHFDHWCPNGNNGSVDGRIYFRCKPGHGYFVGMEHIAHNMGSTISTPIAHLVCLCFVCLSHFDDVL